MEPFLSRDDKMLFFNNSNARNVDTNLHWSSRIDELTFEYRGPVPAANSNALDGVASLDDKGRLYFTSTRFFDPGKGKRSSLFTGVFKKGILSAVHLVEGEIDKNEGLWINMDCEVTANGKELFISNARFRPLIPFPAESNIRLARHQKTKFVIAPDENKIFEHINTANLEYAPCTSANGLELYFTRCWIPGLFGGKPRFLICRAIRKHSDDAFGEPMLIEAIHKEDPLALVEAPTITANGNRLYYHKKVNGIHRIFCVVR